MMRTIELNKIDFRFSGGYNYSNWDANRHEFDLITEEMRRVNMHKKLEAFCIYACKVVKKDAKLPGVDVVDEWERLPMFNIES